MIQYMQQFLAVPKYYILSMPAAKTAKYSGIFSDSCIKDLRTSWMMIGNALV